MQKKNIRQSIPGIILAAYSLLYPIIASFYKIEVAEGVKKLHFGPALGLLVASGLIGATLLSILGRTTYITATPTDAYVRTRIAEDIMRFYDLIKK